MPTRAREEGNGSMGLKHSTVLGRRKRIRGGALLDKGAVPEAPEEVDTLEEGAGRGLLLKSVTMIEYTLLSIL